MKPTLSGRVDLLYALTHDDPSLPAWAAELLGFRAAPAAPMERIPVGMPSPPAEPQPLPPAPYEPADVPFWRLEAYAAVTVDEGAIEPVTSPSSGPLWRLRPDTTPDVTPLAP